MEIYTQDLSEFGSRELALAGELLIKFANETKDNWQGENELGVGLVLGFNTGSGNVFLTDEEGRAALLNGAGKVEMFSTCSKCGVEGFASEDKVLESISEDGECRECLARDDRK